MRGIKRDGLRNRRVFMVLSGTCFVVFLILLAKYTYSERAASVFYQDELQGITTSVTLRGVSYDVKDGHITLGSDSSPVFKNSHEILALAYAKTLTQRAPLFDLSGTDPAKLRSAVEKLTPVQQSIASVQTTKRDMDLVAHALYPSAYLLALADLEVSRRTFASTGSDVAEQEYLSKLKTAVTQGLSDLRAYVDTYRTVTADQTYERQYIYLGGISTNYKTTAALSQVLAAYEQLPSVTGRRVSCMQGTVSACDKGALLLQVPEVAPPKSRTLPASLQDVERIRIGTAAIASSSLIVLASSTCLRARPGPYVMTLHIGESNARLPALEYVGDLFFWQLGTSTKNNALAALISKGISYILFTPTTFYVCPESSDDLSRAFAVDRVAEIVKKYPSKEPSDAERALHSGPHFEQDAVRYMREGLTATSSCTDQCKKDLLGAYLAYRDHGAQLDRIVEEIAYFEGSNVAMKLAGMPSDVSAEFTISVHGAFSQLYLVNNPSTGMSGISVYDHAYDSDLAARVTQLLPWSELKLKISKEKIMSDMRSYFRLHESSQ